jgi:hypothetical protein
VTRLHADPVEVLRHDTGLGPDPAQFLWRSRLYLVREVLARWTESGGWWRTPAVRALTSGDGGPDHGGTSHPLSGVDDGERSWWRVEAGRGMSAGSGIYDLCLDQADGTWVLARVLD